MLRLIAERCTEILLRHGTIQENKRAIYIYGFELFCSTCICIMSIFVLSMIFHYSEYAITFLLCFVPIRTVAGGYHAKSYGGCFLLTNLIAICCIGVSLWLWRSKTLWIEAFLWLLLAVSFTYIWISAPVNSKKYPQKKERMDKNRKYSRRILLIETTLLLLIKLWFDHSVTYTAIITSCVVAVMITMAKKGGD